MAIRVQWFRRIEELVDGSVPWPRRQAAAISQNTNLTKMIAAVI